MFIDFTEQFNKKLIDKMVKISSVFALPAK